MDRLALSNLNLGMTVYKEQLSNILDTLIILKNARRDSIGTLGEIAFIGERPDDTVKRIRELHVPITKVYNSSEPYEITEDTPYEE